MEPIGFVLIGVGLFAIAGGAFDWDWFMSSYKARGITSLFGRQGARIFYIILGLAIAVIGFLVGLGIIENSN